MEVLAVIKIIFMEISPYFEAVPPLISWIWYEHGTS
jgi:hypothetical protein